MKNEELYVENCIIPTFKKSLKGTHQQNIILIAPLVIRQQHTLSKHQHLPFNFVTICWVLLLLKFLVDIFLYLHVTCFVTPGSTVWSLIYSENLFRKPCIILNERHMLLFLYMPMVYQLKHCKRLFQIDTKHVLLYEPWSTLAQRSTWGLNSDVL